MIQYVINQISTERITSTCGYITKNYQVGDAVNAEYLGPRRNRQPRWVPAIVTKWLGSRSVSRCTRLCLARQKRHRPFDLTYLILPTLEAAYRPAYENIGRAKLAAHQA